ARAESFMNYNVNPLVYHTVERPQWMGDGRFWYRDRGADGTTITLVDPAKKTKGPAFDHAKLAKPLSAAMAAGGGRGPAASVNANDNAGWQSSDRPVLVLSPDSKKIATFQQDQRNGGEMFLVPTTNGHPQLKAWKYPLVGDKEVTMIERVVIELDPAKVIRLK